MIKILVVGQTPPPFHGQAMMIEKLLNGKLPKVKIYHVRMAFSKDFSEIGRFRIRKIFHLFKVIFQIVWARLVFGADILYYPPAGPELIPMFRDITILIATRWMFSRTILHFHAGGVSELIMKLSPLGRSLASLAYSEPDCAIGTSNLNPADGEFLHATRNLIIPNGLEDVYPLYANERGVKNLIPRILFVGLLCPSKGVKILLDACGKVKSCGGQFHLEIMGEFYSSEFKVEVDELIKSLDLTSSVTFLGVLTGDEKWKVYANADIFCFPSFYESESFGLVVLEAMQFCLPVVATNWRGIPALVREGETGYLIPIQDSDSLAARLTSLLKDPEKRYRMGKKGREVYLKEFNITKWYLSMGDAIAKTVNFPS